MFLGRFMALPGAELPCSGESNRVSAQKIRRSYGQTW